MRPATHIGRLGVCLVLSGCADGPLLEQTPRPPGRPDRPAATSPSVATAPEPSEESRALSAYYGRVERQLVSQGLLRQDGGGPDTPFDADRLARTFERVALYEEYSTRNGVFVPEETPSRLHRWDVPVRIEARFGATVPAGQRVVDTAAIAELAARLSNATGHPIAPVRSGGNFTVFVVNEEERRALGPQLRALVPQIGDTALRSVIDLPRSNYCVVFALDPSQTGSYSRAVAIIRSEHPDLLRLSCIHEEITQGLGLANDTPTARPSVFNDDEEFALLTTHDEMLLKILYDPRLKPGMTQDEASPIVRRIAAELMGGPA